MPAAAQTRELAFCPECYAALPPNTRCECRDLDHAPVAVESVGLYRVAVDAPRARMLTDRTARFVPAMAAAGVVALVALVAAIIS